MGFGSGELINEFDRRGCDYIEEYQQGLGEAPIDRPYEFCGMIKQSNGEEKKIMDFKTGTPLKTQAPPLWHSCSRRASSWLWIPEQLWATSSHLRPCARSSRSVPASWQPSLVELLIASTGKLGFRKRSACSS